MSAVFEIVNEARQTCMIPCAVYGDQRCCKMCQNPCPDMLECRDKVGVCGLEGSCVAMHYEEGVEG